MVSPSCKTGPLLWLVPSRPGLPKALRSLQLEGLALVSQPRNFLSSRTVSDSLSALAPALVQCQAAVGAQLSICWMSKMATQDPGRDEFYPLARS